MQTLIYWGSRHTPAGCLGIPGIYTNTHRLTPTAQKQSLHLYTQMERLCTDEHTQVIFISTVGIFAGRL